MPRLLHLPFAVATAVTLVEEKVEVVETLLEVGEAEEAAGAITETLEVAVIVGSAAEAADVAQAGGAVQAQAGAEVEVAAAAAAVAGDDEACDANRSHSKRSGHRRASERHRSVALRAALRHVFIAS